MRRAREGEKEKENERRRRRDGKRAGMALAWSIVEPSQADFVSK